MAAYVDYTYYSTTYLGTAIVSADFPRLALWASAQIDALTFDRTAAIVTAATDTATIAKIKMATCAAAEELQRQDANGGADAIQSESTGQNSVSYSVASSKMLTNTQKLQREAALYLGSTGLMFRGFSDGEYGGTVDDNQ